MQKKKEACNATGSDPPNYDIIKKRCFRERVHCSLVLLVEHNFNLKDIIDNRDVLIRNKENSKNKMNVRYFLCRAALGEKANAEDDATSLNGNDEVVVPAPSDEEDEFDDDMEDKDDDMEEEEDDKVRDDNDELRVDDDSKGKPEGDENGFGEEVSDDRPDLPDLPAEQLQLLMEGFHKHFMERIKNNYLDCIAGIGNVAQKKKGIRTRSNTVSCRKNDKVKATHMSCFGGVLSPQFSTRIINLYTDKKKKIHLNNQDIGKSNKNRFVRIISSEKVAVLHMNSTDKFVLVQNYFNRSRVRYISIDYVQIAKLVFWNY